jgi:hypothetical protein
MVSKRDKCQLVGLRASQFVAAVSELLFLLKIESMTNNSSYFNCFLLENML